MSNFFVTLAELLPRFRSRLAITGVIITVAGVVATRVAQPEAIQAQIAAGALGVVFLVFAQMFHSLRDFPATERASLVLRLFYVFAALILGLIFATGYFLVHSRGRESIELTPPPVFDSRATVLPVPSDRLKPDRIPLDSIRASILAAQQGRFLLELGEFGSRRGYPKPIRGIPSFVRFSQADGVNLQTAGFVWDTHGALSRFAIVSHGGGPYVVEHLYVKLHGFAECSLRDEYSELQAPTATPGYAFFISAEHSVYELVPRVGLGQRGTWRLQGRDADEFSLRLEYPAYTLFIVSVVAEVRDESNGDAFRLRSSFYPLLRVENGNAGGCLELEQWFNPTNLQHPHEHAYSALTPDLLTYQTLTVDAQEDRSFLLRLATELPDGALRLLQDSAAVTLQREPANTVFQENVQWLNRLANWRRNGGRGDPP